MNADMHHLVTAYALDALDDDERAEFEAHLATCDVCRAELDGFDVVVSGLAAAAATPPPADLKGRVLAQIADTAQLGPERGRANVVSLSERRRRFAPVAWLASAAAVALLIVGAVVVVGLRDGGSGVDDVRAAPDAVTLALPATPDGGGRADVEIVWSEARDQVALLADGLPDPGAGFVYELWAIADGAPVPSGLFQPDAGSIRDVADIADISPVAWGITIEPDGGSPAPTGEILYFAEI